MEVRFTNESYDQSDAYPQTPTFFFQINKMQQHPQVPPRHAPGGYWVPPKAYGANVPILGDTTAQFFFFDGTTTRHLHGMPQGVELYHQFSVYYADNLTGFWVIDYDALHQEVGDGSQDDLLQAPGEDDPDEDDQWKMDWAQLGFLSGDGEYETDYTSYVTCAGDEHRLLLQRETQQWAWQMFPERYHAPVTHFITRRHADQRHDWGGLIGDLPLILALIAFSVRENEVAQTMQQCVTRIPWQMHSLPRRRGCM